MAVLPEELVGVASLVDERHGHLLQVGFQVPLEVQEQLGHGVGASATNLRSKTSTLKSMIRIILNTWQIVVFFSIETSYGDKEQKRGHFVMFFILFY